MWTLSAILPHQAFAYNFSNPYGVYNISNPSNTIDNANNRVCALNSSLSWSDNLKKYGLVKRLVICVKESTVSAVSNIIKPFSEYFAKTIAIMCTLAVIIWGILVASGKRSAPSREGIVLGMKIGLVIMFTTNFAALYFDPTNQYGGLFGMVLDAMGQMLSIITYYSPFYFSNACPALRLDPDTGFYVDALTGRGDLAIWDFIDCTLDSLIGGIFSPLTLSGGLVGFFLSCMLSNVVGLFIGILGLVMIWMLLTSIAKAVYIFISSYIALAIMVLVSPMFIPLILFASTKAYFEKWLRLTIGFILQPIFIFVFITMFMTAFDVTLFSGQRSVTRAVLGDKVNDPQYAALGFGKYLLNNPHSYMYYTSMKMGEAAAQLNYSQMPGSCDSDDDECFKRRTITKYDSGILGVTGQQINTNVGAVQRGIYEVLGDQNIFKTSVPFTGVNWDHFVIYYHMDTPTEGNMTAAFTAYDICRSFPEPGCDTNPDPLNFLNNYYYPYLEQLMIAMVMAVVTTYIFMIMLEYLPFIGSGISGESLSMPTFGAGNFAPTGSKTFQGIQQRLGGNLFGGGGAR